MICFLRGTLLEQEAPNLTVEVNGIGYEVQMPHNNFVSLPPILLRHLGLSLSWGLRLCRNERIVWLGRIRRLLGIWTSTPPATPLSALDRPCGGGGGVGFGGVTWVAGGGGTSAICRKYGDGAE